MAHFQYLPVQTQDELRKVANAMVAPGKGILASDDGIDGAGSRLKAVGLANTEENRRVYRQMLYSTPGLSNYINAVIMDADTAQRSHDDGTPFPKYIRQQGVIPGINVDKGMVPLQGTDNETTTQGLDDLAKRVVEYRQNGFQFAKLRCAYIVREHTPSPLAILENANLLARYASICQTNGLVPVVEPDITLIDGDHDIDRAQKVSEVVLAAVYKALSDHHVYLEGTVLKPSMVVPGRNSRVKSTPEDVGKATMTALLRTVPPAVAGVAFLSGGQGEEESTLNLNSINKVPAKRPWPTTFCFGRALQETAQTAWAGKNVKAGQEKFIERLKVNSAASVGKYVK
jgi:fructose-bisphosphate aldolase class I